MKPTYKTSPTANGTNVIMTFNSNKVESSAFQSPDNSSLYIQNLPATSRGGTVQGNPDVPPQKLDLSLPNQEARHQMY